MEEVIIIGAGPAGLSAAIYAKRKNLKILVLADDISGQVASAFHVENYLGLGKTSGADLTKKFKEHIDSLGINVKYENVEEISKGDTIKIKTNAGKYESKALIIASGKKPKKLGVKGEDKFLGKGVSYCTVCDGPLFKGKIVAIIGGGNSALESAKFLSTIAEKVYIIHRRNEFRGDSSSVDTLKQKKNVEFVLDSVPDEVKGDKFVNTLVVNNVKTDKKKEIKVNGIFIEVGFEIDRKLFEGIVKMDDKNQVIIDKNNKTSEKNIFAAGDVTDVKYKQMIIAAGDGAKAALAVYEYLTGKVGIDYSG